jgi:RNA polymerase sigma factor (sigma-70 family)
MINDNSFYLKALLDSDSKKIQSIYEKNFPKVKNFILQNKGQQEDAEDIFQKALMQLAIRYQKEKFVIKTSFDGYLFTVCKNLWRRELNKHKNKVTNNQIIELADKNEGEDLALSILEQKRQELFTEMLALISANCNKILKLFFAKTPYSIIVTKMQYNSETVARQRVFKCKKKLTELIKKDKRYNSLKEL